MRTSPIGWLDFDKAAGGLSDQVYQTLRERVLSGDLPNGTLLPSSRGLAAALGVARATVVGAYERLRAEGYIAGTAGSGTRVADLPRSGPPRSAPALALVATTTTPRTRPFEPGVPDLDGFPHRIWARCLAARARSLRVHDLGYGNAAGLPELRSAILAHVAATRGVIAVPEQVIVLPSARTAVALLARRLLRPGDDRVWVEEPGYDTARRVLIDAGGRLTALPVDREGMSWTGAHPSPKIIYVTPSHQYPSGVTMSLSRRVALIEVARSAGALIIEDDYDCEFLERIPIAALQSIDRSGVVAYVGTFSKSLAPGLRIAYVILPTGLVAEIADQQNLFGAVVPIHTQAALADFIREGHFRAHVRRTAVRYGCTMRALADAIERCCGSLVRLDPARTGLQLAVWFTNPHLNDREVAASLAKRGFGAAPLSKFHSGDVSPGLLFGISGAQDRSGPVAQRLFEILQQSIARDAPNLRTPQTTPLPGCGS